ncbi:transcription factor atoh8 [Paramormyrops kingsleyae]|uniref:transcription factor atoh8 n=1 Tax=Paramormyrops kingsleyae TaxID=1676925 RepID=UPI003B9719C9
MKNPQADTEEKLKTLYAKDVNGIRKFKRKSREPVKHVKKMKSYKREPEMDEEELGVKRTEETRRQSEERLQEPNGAACNADHLNSAIDMRIGAFPMTAERLSLQSLHSDPNAEDSLSNASPQVKSFDYRQPFAQDQRFQSRIVLCQRSSEGPFSSLPRASYINTGDRATASPRKRPAETSGVVTEIKAIQQTRRLLANARERTRVHTISAAFEALRKQVPCYSYGQKLSKLAILRIACNYILSLAQLADMDYTPEHSNRSFTECVEQCTRTLQAEGRSKKRKE